MEQGKHLKIQRKIVKAVGITTAIAVLIPAVSIGDGVNTVAAATQGEATKSESVYVNVNSEGKTEKETVSDWLHDDTSGAVIADQSLLSNIVNVKGNEKPKISGNNVTWALSGNDLYYQGKTSKQIPVSMTLQYFLNGKPVSPSDLAGRSGKFELKISFQNHDSHTVMIDGQPKTIYTPFACIAAFNLPEKNFSNVTTNFGNILGDGNNQAVSFIGFPGMKESFSMIDWSSANLPADELDVTADVKDFSLGPIMMVAVPVPDMDSLKGSGDLNDLADKINQLIKAGEQLQDATGQLNSGEQAFSNGVNQLFNGVNTAGSSFDQIVSGANSLNSGAQKVAGGTSQLSEAFEDGSAQNPTLKYDINALNSAAQGAKDQFSSGASNNVKALADGVASGASSYVAGTSALISGLRSNPLIYQSLVTSFNGASDASTKQSLASALVLMTDTSSSSEVNSTIHELGTISVNINAQYIADQQAALSNGGTSLTTYASTLSKQFAPSQTSTPTLCDAVNGVANGTSALYAQMVSSGDPSNPSLYDDINALNSGANSLESGTESLSSALNQFRSGLKTIQNGTSELNDNSKKLASGAAALNNGMSEFWNMGLSKFQNINTNKLKQALQVKDNLITLSDDYTSFTGAGKGIKSNVKFILKTDEIKVNAKHAAHANVPSSTKSVNFWQRIANWFHDIFHSKK